LHTSIEKSKNVIAAEATPMADAGSIGGIAAGPVVNRAEVGSGKSHTHLRLLDILLQAVSQNEEEAIKAELQAKYASRSTLSHSEQGTVGPACSYPPAVCHLGRLPLHSLVRMIDAARPLLVESALHRSI
jgi:hypothetical protein